VVTLRAADLETFLDGGDRPAVLMVKPRSGPWSEVRALFAALSAKLSRFRFAVYNHEEDIDERHLGIEMKAPLALALLMRGLLFVGVAPEGRTLKTFMASKGEDPKTESPETDEDVFSGWFDTDMTSGGITYLWLAFGAIVLFYVYLDLVYGERCVKSSLNVGGEYCYSAPLPTAMQKLAQKS
ncbi:unnamed protein product, partial [Effrenium voratum]